MSYNFKVCDSKSRVSWIFQALTVNTVGNKKFQGRDYSFMLGEMRIRPKNFQTRSGQAQTRRGGSPMEEERTKARN